MNVIMEFVQALLAGQKVPIGSLFLFLGGLVLYRIVGKHIDDAYNAIRHHRSDKDKIIALQRAFIDEKCRSEDNRQLAERAIKQANRYRWDLVLANREIKQLQTKQPARATAKKQTESNSATIERDLVRPNVHEPLARRACS